MVIVGITTVAVIAFGIPLGIAVARMYRDEAVAKLERDATAGVAEVSIPLSSTDTPELPSLTDGGRLAVYDRQGNLIAGNGPRAAEEAVLGAATAPVSNDDLSGSFVVALPVGNDENVVAIVRAALPRQIVADRVHRAWMAMVGLGLAIVGAAAIVALWQARRLSRPVTELVRSADRLGRRDFAVRTSRSGIPELDAAAAALDDTARRLGELMERERAFSAHASHQLRTPLAGLRVQLEVATTAPEADMRTGVTDALASVDRLQQTIDDLLSLARHTSSGGASADVAALFSEVEQQWHGRLAATGRPLRLSIEPGSPPTSASTAAVRQILGVLVANAAEHGAGVVTLTARNAAGALAVEVKDEGTGIANETNDVFAPRADAGSDHGIGLGLARALAVAEGGRLLLTHHGPKPIFRLLLPVDIEGSPAAPAG